MRSIMVILLGLLLASALATGSPARAVGAQVIVLSNSSPHLSVIDARTHQVVKTADIPQMTSWTWNDDNNYSDGLHLWLGMRNPDTNDVEVVLLDLNTLQIARRIPLGKDAVTLYIGKPSKQGRVLVSKHASGEVVAIDSKRVTVQRTVKVITGTGVACDMDVATGPDGIERAFVPTNDGNEVLSLDPSSLQTLRTRKFSDTLPFMLTASPGGSHVWVQERTGHSLTILDTRTLQVVKRLPAGRTPIVGTFSPDGTLHFTGHAADTVVMANDTKTFKEVWRARVGTSPDKLGVHPAGTFVYAALSREGAVAVLDARTGKVVLRVSLGTNPVGIFVRPVQ